MDLSMRLKRTGKGDTREGKTQRLRAALSSRQAVTEMPLAEERLQPFCPGRRINSAGSFHCKCRFELFLCSIGRPVGMLPPNEGRAAPAGTG